MTTTEISIQTCQGSHSILRVIGLMVKCQNILDLRKILIYLFIVITNETDESDINTGLATPRESH